VHSFCFVDLLLLIHEHIVMTGVPLYNADLYTMSAFNMCSLLQTVAASTATARFSGEYLLLSCHGMLCSVEAQLLLIFSSHSLSPHL
jgi:hypothetical protein